MTVGQRLVAVKASNGELDATFGNGGFIDVGVAWGGVPLVYKNIVVVVAAGNGETETFPASMEEVIAVGGVTIDTADALSVWVDSSAYATTFVRGRDVPDLCGIAGSMMLPAGVTSVHPEGWRDKDGATSAATAQVAGVAALLVQKDPTQTPAQIRAVMKAKATDIVLGTTASGVAAQHGPDLATGAGLVNALAAWNAI